MDPIKASYQGFLYLIAVSMEIAKDLVTLDKHKELISLVGKQILQKEIIDNLEVFLI